MLLLLLQKINPTQLQFNEMQRVLGTKRKFGEVEKAEEKKRHAYECLIFGTVQGEQVKSLLKRVNVLCDDLAQRVEDLCVLESVYADNRSMQQLRVRCQQPPGSRQLFAISLLGNFHRGKDLPAPTRSCMHADVSRGIYDFLNSLGMKFLFETARKGARFVTRDGIGVDVFRVVQAKSMSEFLKHARTSGEDETKQKPPLAFVVPEKVGKVEDAPMLVKISAKAESEEDLAATAANVRAFADKLGTTFEEIKPEDYS